MLIVPMLDQGGLERVCAATAQLLKTEYEVHLVVFNTDGMIYDVSGVDLIDLHLGAVKGKVGKALNVMRRVWRTKLLKKALHIQLSYSFGPTANLVNVLSKGKEVVWAGIRGYGALNDTRSMELVCSRADRVISCTKIMEQQIALRFQPKQSAAIYNPCDLYQIKAWSVLDTARRFDKFFARKGRLVASMGREHDVKGFWHLIKAVALAKKDIPDLRLMIIGAGEYEEYRKLAKELGIEEDVLFTGVQSNPFPYLRRADVYALTSESEGFPNALIEAMAVGLPCISVNCKTGPAEILHEDFEKCSDENRVIYADYGILTGVFRGEKDLDATHVTAEEERFAAELVKLLTDDNRYWHLRHAAEQRAKQFSMETYLEAIEKLIETDVSH